MDENLHTSRIKNGYQLTIDFLAKQNYVCDTTNLLLSIAGKILNLDWKQQLDLKKLEFNKKTEEIEGFTELSWGIPSDFVKGSEFIKELRLFHASTLSRILSSEGFRNKVIYCRGEYYIQPEDLLVHLSKQTKNTPVKTIAVQFLGDPQKMKILHKLMNKG